MDISCVYVAAEVLFYKLGTSPQLGGPLYLCIPIHEFNAGEKKSNSILKNQ